MLRERVYIREYIEIFCYMHRHKMVICHSCLSLNRIRSVHASEALFTSNLLVKGSTNTHMSNKQNHSGPKIHRLVNPNIFRDHFILNPEMSLT